MPITRRHVLSSAAAAGSLPFTALAQTGGETLVVGIAADPTGFDPEAVPEQHLGVHHGHDLRQPGALQAGHGRVRAGPGQELGHLVRTD